MPRAEPAETAVGQVRLLAARAATRVWAEMPVPLCLILLMEPAESSPMFSRSAAAAVADRLGSARPRGGGAGTDAEISAYNNVTINAYANSDANNSFVNVTGGSSDGNAFAGVGGSASAIAIGTATSIFSGQSAVTLNAIAYGESGGSAYGTGSGGAGGAATATAIGTNSGPDNVTVTATAVGGAGGEGQGVGNAGGNGGVGSLGTVSGTSSDAGNVTVSASVTGGAGGFGGPNGNGGAGGNGASEMLNNAVTGSTNGIVTLS